MRLFPRTLKLRQRLALLLLIASVPGMAVAVVLAVNALAVQTEQIETSAARLAALHAAQHTAVVESARLMLDALIGGEALADVERSECASFLKGWIERYPSFTSLTLVDAAGDVVCSSADSELPFDPADRPWFERVRAEKDFVVGQYTIGRNGVPLIVAAQPVLESDGMFDGAMAVGIDLRWLEFLARRAELPARATVTALDADGGVLVHYAATPPAEEGAEAAARADEPAPSERLRREMPALGRGVVRGSNAAGAPRVYGFHGTDTGGLVVAVGMPPYVFFARYGAALRDTLAAPLAILLLALAAAWWGAEVLITRWVRSLTRAAKRMAGGDLGARSGVPHSTYEIGELAAAFDGMADALERDRGRLRAALAQRETLLREVNHRVKNNMQLVVSILRLGAGRIRDEAAREEIRAVSHRVEALATIHGLLHEGGRTEHSAAADYPERLCASLAEVYGSGPDSAPLAFDLQPVALPLDQAIPFGLVLNELVANAFEHAFADGRTGTVRVRLTVEDGGAPPAAVHLTVSDDGVGPPPGFDPASVRSTGLKVARALATQLGGALAFERPPAGGAAFHLRFPLKQPPGGG